MKPWRLLLIVLVLLPLAAFGQSQNEKRARIDKLLDDLKAAPGPEVAAPLEEKLFHAWLDTTTAAVKLLIIRAQREIKGGDYDTAVETLDDAIVLDPNLAEAWHQRALAKWHGGDTMGAIRDLEETLKREPQDFTAFRTLSMIAAAREDWKSAYAAWEKMLEISPQTPGGEEKLKELKKKAFGEDT
jgi:tetratricopeptide (TPR) repeat protein